MRSPPPAANGQFCTITSADPNARDGQQLHPARRPRQLHARFDGSAAGGAPSSTRSARCSRRSSRRAPTSRASTSPARRACRTSPRPGKTRSRGSCRPPASSTAIPSSTCSPGARRRSSRSRSSCMRPNETNIGALPNEDSQSFMFDASEPVPLQQVRRLGSRRGRRAAQCRRPVHRPVQSGRLPQRPGRTVLPSVRTEFVRGGEPDQYRARQRTGQGPVRLRRARDLPAQLAARRSPRASASTRATTRCSASEYEASFNFERWTTTVMYGYYAPQPAIGFLDGREGVTSTARFKVVAELADLRRRPLRPAGQSAQRDPDRHGLRRRLPHLGRELHYRIPL